MAGAFLAKAYLPIPIFGFFLLMSSLVLHGQKRRFVLPPVAHWSGKQRLDAVATPTYPSNIGDYKIHKNAQVRAGEGLADAM